ncbi:MAG: NADH dehydrogenase ubiquinone Fe-S protein 4, partial [Candidatus Puniceispirillaceae bacterium]
MSETWGGEEMRVAKIYKPAKTAMQSGRKKTEGWVLDYPRGGRVSAEPLMGWQASADTARQVKLRFDSEGSRRAQFRFNREVIDDKLAVVVAGLYSDQELWR